MATHEGLALTKSFMRINSVPLRRIVRLVEQIKQNWDWIPMRSVEVAARSHPNAWSRSRTPCLAVSCLTARVESGDLLLLSRTLSSRCGIARPPLN